MCCVGACRMGARALMGGIRPMPGTSAGFVGESPASSKSSTASVCPSSSPQMARWSALYPSGPTAVGSAPGCASSMRRHLAHPPKAEASNGVKPPPCCGVTCQPRARVGSVQHSSCGSARLGIEACTALPPRIEVTRSVRGTSGGAYGPHGARRIAQDASALRPCLQRCGRA